MVAAGRARLSQPLSVRTLSSSEPMLTVLPRPPAGTQPSITANTMISIRPTQKLGSENPSTEPVMMAREPGACGLSPARMPSGTPISTDSSMATQASSTVAGMRSRIRGMAGSPVRKLLPKSPCTAWPMKIRYCRHSGWSRPSDALIAARCASVASGLASIDTGSPTM
ncbi:hypothetical protein G6F31_015519 [Rhizopus arrhizus]|nr:hypothetical protein G6F31_015519 [Rhizopus arrhizus]